MLTLLYLFFIAFLQSSFLKIFFLSMLYAIAYFEKMPKKNWYGYEDYKLFTKQKTQSLKDDK